MRRSVVEVVALAFRGDLDGSRLALERTAPDDDLAWALWSFAAADYDDFSRRTITAPVEADPDRRAVRSALRTVRQTQCEGRVVVPVDETAVARDSPVAGLVGYLLSASAWASGLLERGEQISRRVLERTAGSDPFVPWVRITRLRVLGSLGPYDEAAAELELLRGEVVGWPHGEVLMASHEAVLAGIRGDAPAVEAEARRTRAAAPHPTDQLSAMAVAVTGLVLSAVGRPRSALHAALAAGNDLELLPMVTRCHAGDLVIEMCLQLGLVDEARRHLRRSESFGVEAGSFAAAAVERSQARMRAADGESLPAAGAHAEMYIVPERASADVSSLSTDAADLEDLTRRVAGAGLAEVRSWARREAGDEESAQALFTGLGWDALPAQAKVVARLAASGMRNRDIGTTLFLAEKTVESYVGLVLATVGTQNRVGIGDRVPFHAPSQDLPAMTTRQAQVAELLAQGLRNAEIARRLAVSDKTVEKHVKALFTLFGVRSRAAVAAAIRGS